MHSSRLSNIGLPAAALTLALLMTGPAAAVQVRPLNVEQMTERAERVVHGRCLEARRMIHPTLGLPVIEARFEVLRAVKGAPQTELTIRVLADVATLPTFTAGEDVVLFLYGESEMGLTSPVGLAQGKFTVVEDKLGRKVAVNAYGNRHLSRNLSVNAIERLGVEIDLLRAEREVEVDRLLDWAARLEGSR